MVRGDKNPAEVESPAEENDEIDRIMKEIEDLEKKMDSAPEEETSGTEGADAAIASAEPAAEAVETAAVLPLRPSSFESLAETDAVPAADEPLIADAPRSEDGGLSLKIGGCAQVSLEFTRSGISVSLTCNDDGLCITTDQGAEFRIPLKRAA